MRPQFYKALIKRLKKTLTNRGYTNKFHSKYFHVFRNEYITIVLTNSFQNFFIKMYILDTYTGELNRTYIIYTDYLLNAEKLIMNNINNQVRYYDKY